MISPSVDDNEGSEFAGFVVNARREFCGRQKNGGGERDEANERGDIAIP